MLLYKNRIVVTGGAGRFGSELKKTKSKYQLLFPTKQKLNILKLKTIDVYLKKYRPKYLLHLAGLSRPMKIHEKNIDKIFNRFYSNRPEKFGEHSGLGLNIVKNIIELHGGSIIPSNQMNKKKGARIEVLLPIYK